MKGFVSVHPSTEKRLRRCGIKDADVTQGVGSATLSAGTHLKVGTCEGRAFGHCVDLRWGSVEDRARFDRLVAAGFAPFRRDWAGNQHWHLVDCTGLKDDSGEVPAPRSLVRVQILDFCDGRSGLVGHAPLDGAWAPDHWQAEAIEADLIDHANCSVVLVRMGDKWVDCYAYLERGTVRCELRPLVEALGGVVRWSNAWAIPCLTVTHDKKTWEAIPLPESIKAWRARIEGSFVRCALRPVAENLGHTVEWDPQTLRVVIGKEV